MSSKQKLWYGITTKQTAQEMNTNIETGLSTQQILRLREKYGSNTLTETKKESVISAYLRQYKEYMQIIFLIAAGMSFIVKDYSTGLLLISITLLNAYLSLRSERRAEESVAVLKKMMHITSRVRRDSKITEIPMDEIVPGDIILFEAGDRIPADGRLTTAASLEIEESTLTGESMPAQKKCDVLTEDTLPLGDQNNIAFMNTNVTRGRGEMIVTGTGMNTEIGKIAQLLQEIDEEISPLQKQVNSLTIIIAIMAGCAFVIMMLVGFAYELPFSELYAMAIILAIASLPGALPLVVTSSLSLGTREMAQRGAIIKKLPAVETLGSTSAICSDKTGTLTLNKMTARSLLIAGNRYEITGKGYQTEGHIKHIGGQNNPNLDPYLIPMALCTDALLKEDELIGDPTEGALIVLAEKGNISIEQTRQQYPRIAEIPFDSSYKFMATFHKMKNSAGEEIIRCYIKGAPDVLIERSSYLKDTFGKNIPLDNDMKKRVQNGNDELAKEGMRILVVAQKDINPKDFNLNDSDLLAIVSDITLLAMVGIVDPPRSQARDAIAACKDAGIRVRMITGDHVVTAAAIAKQLGIEGIALTGVEFAQMNDEEVLRKIDNIGVIARVTPQDKIRLVELLKQTDKIVAMTGDGVNDAPALKKADVGIAMGITGTDVSKEAAVMILTDDNFSTIVSAVEYGRSLYNNLLKFIRFQLAILSAFIISFISAAMFGVTFSLFSPLQIIFVKFCVTGIIGVAFAFDKPTKDLMKQKPRKASEKIVKWPLIIRLFVIGVFVAIFTITGYQWSLDMYDSITHAQTMALVTFGFLAIPYSLSLRRPFKTIFTRETFTNKKLIISYVSVVTAMLLVTTLPFLQKIFNTVNLTQPEWVYIFIVVILFFIGGELFKFIRNAVHDTVHDSKK